MGKIKVWITKEEKDFFIKGSISNAFLKEKPNLIPLVIEDYQVLSKDKKFGRITIQREPIEVFFILEEQEEKYENGDIATCIMLEKVKDISSIEDKLEEDGFMYREYPKRFIVQEGDKFVKIQKVY